MDIANSEAQKALRAESGRLCDCQERRDHIPNVQQGHYRQDVTAHAELMAISDACKKLKARFLGDCIIYANIEPCLMCAKAMVYARINKVVYGTGHKEYGSKKTFDILKQNEIASDMEVVSGIGKGRASELLNKFFRSKIEI